MNISEECTEIRILSIIPAFTAMIASEEYKGQTLQIKAKKMKLPITFAITPTTLKAKSPRRQKQKVTIVS
jgi:hypothetical protein